MTRTTTTDLAERRERALAMRYRRFEQRRAEYADLIDIPRHLAALGRYDAVADDVLDTMRFLTGTLTRCAYLAEVRSFVPPVARAWGVIADQEISDLLRMGDLSSATYLGQLMLRENQRRAAADPGNTEWQRDLSVSHNGLGDIERASGDINAARRAHQASLDIITRLAALDPGNAQWREDVEFTRRRLADLTGEVPPLAPANLRANHLRDTRARGRQRAGNILSGTGHDKAALHRP